MTAPIGPTGESEIARRARLRRNLAKLKELGAPPEAVQEYIERERITPDMELASAPRTGIDDLAGGVQSTVQGLTFNFGDEIAGALDGLVTPGKTMGEGIAEQRESLRGFREAHPKTALGLELAGGLASGLGAAGAAKGAGALTARGVLASGIGGGALAGAGAGESTSGRVIGAGVGAGLGGALGFGASKLATSNAGDKLARGGRNLLEMLAEAADGPAAVGTASAPAAQRSALEMLDPAGQAAVRSIFERMGSGADEALPKARAAFGNIRGAGLADDAMGADVLPGGGRELRRAANISPAGEEMARTRLGERGAQVGVRARRALTEATGLPEQTTSAGVDDLVAQRAAKAKPLYDAAMEEGRGKVATPQLRAFLQEPPIQRAIGLLRGLDEFRGVADDSPEMLDAVYKVLSDRHATIKASQLVDPENLGRFQQRDLESAKTRFLNALSEPGVVDVPVAPPSVAQSPAPSLRDAIEAHRTRLGQSVTRREGTVAQQSAREALERRSASLDAGGTTGNPTVGTIREEVPAVMPSYRAAVTQFAEDSQLKNAYESGVDLFNKPVGDIRSAMAAMKPDEAELFKRGVFDALIEKRVNPISPNPDLGDVARQSKLAGQATVNTQAAADRIRAVFGEDEYQRLLNVARAEGRFTQTANDALANSTTAKQLRDMGVFGQFAQDAAESISPSPEFWAARMARGVARRGADKWAQMFNEPANQRAVDLLTQRGEQPVQNLLELLEQLGQSDAARKAAIQPVTGAAARTATPQMP